MCLYRNRCSISGIEIDTQAATDPSGFVAHDAAAALRPIR